MRAQLKRVIGTPHELLHVLALALIGRRAVKMAHDHVIIPDDLTTTEYAFVAGLPALVFFSLLVGAAVWLINAQTAGQAGIAVGVIIAATVAAAGTVGDLQLIMMRLSDQNTKR